MAAKCGSSGVRLDCRVVLCFVHTFGDTKLSGFDIMRPLTKVFSRSDRGAKISLSG